MYLTLGYVSFFKIHLGYIQDTFQDTMYLNPQIHDTQDTLTIHVGYIGIHSRIRTSISKTPEPYLRARLNARWGDALGASLAALGALAGALAGALGATAATAAPLPPFCFLAGLLGGSFRRRPVAVALTATALACPPSGWP